MFHEDILQISYRHQFEVKKVFSDILGINGIDHFSLDLVSPKGEMIFLSSTPSHGYEICNRGYGQFDGIISPEYYHNYEFYWWRNACHKAYSNRINAIREGILGLQNGFMLIRKWDDFTLIYSFATKRGSVHFQSTVINQINQFLEMGDYAYNALRETYTLYCSPFIPPKIETFFPYEGGPPPKRYSQAYKSKNMTKLINSNVIYLDSFKPYR